MKYIIGLIFIGLGYLVVWKTTQIVNGFGRIAWAENKLGPGGTFTFYKLFGVGLIVFGFLVMTGAIIDLLDWIFPF